MKFLSVLVSIKKHCCIAFEFICEHAYAIFPQFKCAFANMTFL